LRRCRLLHLRGEDVASDAGIANTMALLVA
jgi:hypothetical protein